MKYTKLGRTGVDVSKICLGCMSYGDPGLGAHSWSMTEEASLAFYRQAVELGINFFDTANVYSLGSSEEITGRALAEFTRRDEVVIATKVHGVMRPGPNGGGLSRKAILFAIDESLRRLNLDYVDLYQVHRWDPSTPIEETMEALHDVVRSGKARYIGASSMWTWQFAKAQFLADRHGWTRFVTMQNHYNLINREDEREMLPFCIDQGVGVIPWSPLARGRLARAWGEMTGRSESDVFGGTLYPDAESDRAIIDRVGELAELHGVNRAQVALAWLLQQPGVSSPIVGATRSSHLTDAAAAVELTLSQSELESLAAPYTPREPAGFV